VERTRAMNLNPWNAEDRGAAVALVVLAVVTALALVVVSLLDSIHNDSAWRDAILKGAGGFLLLGGSYYGARTLTQGRADQRASRALKAIEFMGHEKPDVQKAGRALLASLAGDAENSPRDEVQTMIRKVADAVARPREHRPD
jgi:hypothetical protein